MRRIALIQMCYTIWRSRSPPLRARWQVELNVKRWKSIFDLHWFRAYDPDLARAYIYAKLIASCLAGTLARSARAFSPWGVPTSPFTLAAGCLA